MSTRIFRFQIQFFAVLMICGVPAWAYDAETHALITLQAYRASLLFPQGAGSTSMRLGLDRLDAPLPFNAYWLGQPDSGTYYDNTATFDPTQTPRHPDAYEQCQMVNLLKAGGIPTSDPMVSADGKDVSFLPIQNWLMRGVLREDDLNALLYFTIGSSSCGKPRNPDPYGQVVRVLNHFYDPINDVPLNAGAFCGFAPTGQCLKSVDWALGVVDSFATPQVVDTNRRNHFTYADARENMWRALTGERNSTAPA